MEQSLYPGSQTFEQALCRMYLDGKIGYDEAMAASDSPTNLAWLINQNAPTSRVENLQQARGPDTPRLGGSDFTALQIEPELLERP
jgi:twitching motility protein PilU